MKTVKAIHQPGEWYKSRFDAFERSLNGDSKTALHELRREAIGRFQETGFPTNRNEEWKFTNVSPIAQIGFEPVLRYAGEGVTLEQLAPLALPGAHRLVFVNGFFSKPLSSTSALPEGIQCGSLASAVRSSHEGVGKYLGKLVKFDETPFVLLNTAFLLDGAFLFIPDNIVLEEPIQFLFLATGDAPALITPRNLVVIGNRSQATIVESYGFTQSRQYLTNVVTEMYLGEGAVVEHDKLQHESTSAYHVAMMQVNLSGHSTLTSNSIALGGSIARNNITTILDGEGIECTLNGLSLGTGSQLIDNHTTIDHAKPHCESHQLYKAILDGSSRGVFNGKIFVRQDAQKTDAKQTNKTLLLSDDATMDTKPQLEIFADDVKCTHGATIGQLDAEQIFYLRSRGIDESKARDILTFAFASDVVRRVHHEALRDRLEILVHERLSGGRAIGD
ncbi:MAG: Fe-S cluster assembly protein SufD [Ignavibacteria bacterium GWA2_54_16]|nr:MAG: Fe-S cluster assembly protein SufD [Ignavibacteria bacterium GWA2_54_16]